MLNSMRYSACLSFGSYNWFETRMIPSNIWANIDQTIEKIHSLQSHFIEKANTWQSYTCKVDMICQSTVGCNSKHFKAPLLNHVWYNDIYLFTYLLFIYLLFINLFHISISYSRILRIFTRNKDYNNINCYNQCLSCLEQLNKYGM